MPSDEAYSSKIDKALNTDDFIPACSTSSENHAWKVDQRIYFLFLWLLSLLVVGGIASVPIFKTLARMMAKRLDQ